MRPHCPGQAINARYEIVRALRNQSRFVHASVQVPANGLAVKSCSSSNARDRFSLLFELMNHENSLECQHLDSPLSGYETETPGALASEQDPSLRNPSDSARMGIFTSARLGSIHPAVTRRIENQKLQAG